MPARLSILLCMGIGVVVHGFIEFPAWGNQAESQRVFRHNQSVVDSLPVSDAEWPLMPRVMFAVLPLRPSLEVGVPQHENGLIHFAGDYKNMFTLEANWIRKFEERLLGRMCWVRAVVNLDFSSLRYEWQVDLQSLADQHQRNPPMPPREWMFRCLKLNEERLESKQAIDGEWASPFHVQWKDLA